jgi:hypothetical protein
LIYFKVFLWFIKAIFSGIFHLGDKKWQIAGKELISKPTFRLPDSAANDRLIGFRLLKRVWTGFKKKIILDNTYEVLIFDAAESGLKARLDYVLWNKDYHQNSIYSVGRDKLIDYINEGYTKLFLILSAFYIIPFSIFSKNRVQWSMLYSEYTELVGLLTITEQIQPNKLHFFSPGEKDSNFIFLILKKTSRVEIFKHPSPGALIAHNKNLMTDTLVLSSNYQAEEFKLLLNKTIFCSKTTIWQAESSKNYIDLYKNKKEDSGFEYLLGFYSHGGWLRKKTNLSQALFANPDEEESCLKIVAQYVNDNNIKLKIYLHPKEKKYFIDAKKYYQSYINEKNIVYYTDTLPSSFDFKAVKIGICAYSAILFERDNLGFETLVWREKNNNFPLIGTKLHEKSFNNSTDFNCLIKKAKLETFN